MATIQLNRLVAARDALKSVYAGWLDGAVILPPTTRVRVERALSALEGTLSNIGAMLVEIRQPDVEEPTT